MLERIAKTIVAPMLVLVLLATGCSSSDGPEAANDVVVDPADDPVIDPSMIEARRIDDFDTAAISPDGSHLVFQDNDLLCGVELDDIDARTCADLPSSVFVGTAGWSPSGDSVVFSDGFSSIVRWDIGSPSIVDAPEQGDGESQWAGQAPTIDAEGASWHFERDDEGILRLVRWVDQRAVAVDAELPDVPAFNNAMIAPDGRLLAVSVGESRDPAGLAVIDVEARTTEVHALTDGRMLIADVSEQHGLIVSLEAVQFLRPSEPLVVDLDTGRRSGVPLPDEAYATGAAFDPSGQFVVVAVVDLDLGMGLEIFRTEDLTTGGTLPRPVANVSARDLADAAGAAVRLGVCAGLVDGIEWTDEAIVLIECTSGSVIHIPVG